MAYNRFSIAQGAFVGEKVLYELILEEPYLEGRKPSDAVTSLDAKTPDDIALGSTAIYYTVDADGNRIMWKFEYQQTAVDEQGWVIVKVLDGGVAPIPLEVTENAKYEGNGATAYTPVDVNVPNPSTGTLQITENGESIDVSSYAYVDVNVSGGGDFNVFKVTINADPEVQGSQYYVVVEENEDHNYDGVFVHENGFHSQSPYVGGEGESSLVVDLVCSGDSVTNVYLPSMLTASSGAIEYDAETYHYIISGDCSVTGWLDD